MESQPVRTIPTALALPIVLSMTGLACAGAPLKYAPPAEALGPALFTIYLPHGWTMGEKGPRGPKAFGFVFSQERAAFPYIIVQAENCDPQELTAHAEAAAELPSRRLLSGGDQDTPYFDSSRDVTWEQSRSPNLHSVAVTIVGERVATLKFFDDGKDADAFALLVGRVLEHFVLHAPDKEIPSSVAGVAAESFELDPDTFTAAAPGTRILTSPLLWVTVLTVAGLLVVVRRIRQREDEQRIAEAEAAREARRSRAPKTSLRQADQQVQDWARDVKQRRQS
jgi:hypothetical protein